MLLTTSSIYETTYYLLRQESLADLVLLHHNPVHSGYPIMANLIKMGK